MTTIQLGRTVANNDQWDIRTHRHTRGHNRRHGSNDSYPRMVQLRLLGDDLGKHIDQPLSRRARIFPLGRYSDPSRRGIPPLYDNVLEQYEGSEARIEQEVY